MLQFIVGTDSMIITYEVLSGVRPCNTMILTNLISTEIIETYVGF
jgi:hypothetical protein